MRKHKKRNYLESRRNPTREPRRRKSRNNTLSRKCMRLIESSHPSIRSSILSGFFVRLAGLSMFLHLRRPPIRPQPSLFLILRLTLPSQSASPFDSSISTAHTPANHHRSQPIQTDSIHPASLFSFNHTHTHTHTIPMKYPTTPPPRCPSSPLNSRLSTHPSNSG